MERHRERNGPPGLSRPMWPTSGSLLPPLCTPCCHRPAPASIPSPCGSRLCPASKAPARPGACRPRSSICRTPARLPCALPCSSLQKQCFYRSEQCINRWLRRATGKQRAGCRKEWGVCKEDGNASDGSGRRSSSTPCVGAQPQQINREGHALSGAMSFMRGGRQNTGGGRSSAAASTRVQWRAGGGRGDTGAATHRCRPIPGRPAAKGKAVRYEGRGLPVGRARAQRGGGANTAGAPAPAPGSAPPHINHHGRELLPARQALAPLAAAAPPFL